MSNENRKFYSKKGTGTVPKIKHHNNSISLNQDDRFSNMLSNNLARHPDRSDIQSQVRNVSRNLGSQVYLLMDPNDTQNSTVATNGSDTPSTSRSNSRRNSLSSTIKCDNVSKYPDKKQIESKLSQIREYIQATSSLRANMKNTDDQSNEEEMDVDQLDQMINDLVDSETKLVLLLQSFDEKMNEKSEFSEASLETVNEAPNKNGLEDKMEAATREMQMLKEQENLILHLQLNAENQLRETRSAQEKLLKGHHINQIHTENDALVLNGAAAADVTNAKNFEIMRDIQERLKSINFDGDGGASKNFTEEQYENQIESLQSHLFEMREANDNRNQLIQMLDNRDAQLQAEHSALQGKLLELQNKKMQVDQLVMQLQTMNNEESEDDEMGCQVKRIVNMKEQLAKLKDMLNLVQNTENSIEAQNVNGTDIEEHVRHLCTKTDNLVQNDSRTNRQRQFDNNAIARLDYNSSHSSNEPHLKDKQVNKKSMKTNEKESIKLQAELQAKKRQLEELMYKHIAATSNLNQDVNSENKSDLGQTSNPLLENATNSWFPSTNVFNFPQSSERYSSDDCPEDDLNEYSELNSSSEVNSHVVQPMPSLNYPTMNYTKRRDEEPKIELPPEPYSIRPSRTPDHSVRSVSLAPPIYHRENTRINSNSENKSQMQKQLELIRSVCNSMLEANNTQPNVQVRNNLTPSPIYSEPRQYTPPSTHALNVINPTIENMPMQSVPTLSTNDPGSYQNWLATNTLQTQAFMLNTLNQCCQMLWLQQRELSSLRNTVNAMQERYQQSGYDTSTNTLTQCMGSNHCLYPPTPNHPSTNNHFRSPNHTKVNPPPPSSSSVVVVGGAASLPNLNHSHCSQSTTNIEHACASHCNLQNARILDSALNNSISVQNHQNVIGEHDNQVINAIPSQIWNGQALNNQVPPGTRANNYWDNFRSYSRQNLLSTKSNETLQNLSDRPNNSGERLAQAAPKLNTNHHESSSLENTPKHPKASRQRSNSSIAAVATNVQPDVLNVKPNESFLSDFNSLENNTAFYYLPNAYASGSDDTINKDSTNVYRNRNNEWHNNNNQVDSQAQKSKLFDELRENVYKEVASLISANQGRPHFLIQLFRDLQLISSDPLRRRTLQSIQSVITNSLSAPGNATGAMRQVVIAQNADNENIQEDAALPGEDFFNLPTFSWPKENASSEPNTQEHLSEVLNFLNIHKDDAFSDNLLHTLRDTLVESTFSGIFTNTNNKDGLIQKHFASLLTEALEQYHGKKVQDVRLSILQTVENLLKGEISLIRLMRENISESDLSAINSSFYNVQPFDMKVPIVNENPPPQMQNGDLAEADQSRLDAEDEDEGAVGGVLNILMERSTSSNAGQVLPDENDLTKIDLVLHTESDAEFVEQGLDQVPTRLTTHTSTRSNTPNKGL